MGKTGREREGGEREGGRERGGREREGEREGDILSSVERTHRIMREATIFGFRL